MASRRMGGGKNAEFLELGCEDIPVERLHDVLVRSGIQSARDIIHIVFGRAENDLRGWPSGIARNA